MITDSSVAFTVKSEKRFMDGNTRKRGRKLKPDHKSGESEDVTL